MVVAGDCRSPSPWKNTASSVLTALTPTIARSPAGSPDYADQPYRNDPAPAGWGNPSSAAALTPSRAAPRMAAGGEQETLWRRRAGRIWPRRDRRAGDCLAASAAWAAPVFLPAAPSLGSVGAAPARALLGLGAPSWP